MNEFITFVLGENSNIFTPATVLAIFALCLGLECIASIISNTLRAGGM